MKYALYTAAMALLMVAPVGAQTMGTRISPVAGAREVKDVTVQREEIAQQLATIRSLDDLHAYLIYDKTSKTPLDNLSPVNRRIFIDSLTFNDSGLTGYSRAALENELTPSQAYKLLSLFGAQRTTSMLHHPRIESDLDKKIMTTPNPLAPSDMIRPTMKMDYDNYRCSSRATCAQNISTICMSGC